MGKRITTRRRSSPEEFAEKVPEIRKMAGTGAAHREIAKRLGVSRYRALKFVRENGLIPPERRKNRPAHRRQKLRLPVNLQRVPDANEADVRLAERAWREFERADG